MKPVPLDIKEYIVKHGFKKKVIAKNIPDDDIKSIFHFFFDEIYLPTCIEHM